jgi:hypothetical protein
MERVVATLADVGRAEDMGSLAEGSRDLTVTINPLRQPVKKAPQDQEVHHRLRRHERLAQGVAAGEEDVVDDVDDDEDDEDDDDDEADDEGDDEGDEADDEAEEGKAADGAPDGGSA